MRMDPAGRPHKWNTFQQRLGRLGPDFNVISWHATRTDPQANVPTASVPVKTPKEAQAAIKACRNEQDSSPQEETENEEETRDEKEAEVLPVPKRRGQKATLKRKRGNGEDDKDRKRR